MNLHVPRVPYYPKGPAESLGSEMAPFQQPLPQFSGCRGKDPPYRGVFLPPLVRRLATPSKRNPSLRGRSLFHKRRQKESPGSIPSRTLRGRCARCLHEVISREEFEVGAPDVPSANRLDGCSPANYLEKPKAEVPKQEIGDSCETDVFCRGAHIYIYIHIYIYTQAFFWCWHWF